MKKYIFFFCTLFVSLMALTFSSCSEDEALLAESSSVTDDTNLTTITFQVSSGSYGTSTRADGDETEHGDDDSSHNEDGFESLTDYNYVYIYSTDNYYLGKITNLELKHNDGDDTAIYSCTGQVNIKLPSSFKVVFLGNFYLSSYISKSKRRDGIDTRATADPTTGVSPGLYQTFTEPKIGSTLEDLWTPIDDNGLCPYFNYYQCPADAIKGEPFYGIHLFEDVVIEEDDEVVLSEPITLMRAMAKIEIISNYHGLEGPYLYNVNEYGYPIPKDVYTQYDYDNAQLNVYNKTYTIFHTDNFTLNEDGSCYCELYMFEQDNHISNLTTTTCPVIRLLEAAVTSISYPLYFGEYDQNGECHAYDDSSEENMAKRWDIRRNHVYRYNITIEAGSSSGAKAIDPSIKKNSSTPSIKVKSEMIELK